ncbi:sodium- and chloride-dependent creatine transporter 1-like [Haliotis rubra]|uniref:sodium- and chloride-dependent creatine transporter 1-like n=1 Tax=Haliotis rubra TaxID=36100 RepID=UPI001EE4FECE|nr:sodium- and chloride-dependent creatine transporter 1-like [Haliotis rubra]
MSHGEKRRKAEAGEQGQMREVWTNKREYILSQIGFAVGLGTFWRFPYLCNRNGGGAFLIPYFCGIFLCAVPLFFLEVSIGQFSSRSAAHVWDMCPLFKGQDFPDLLSCERVIGKVVYVTAVLPYILLTVLLIRSCMMPGSVDGLLYFLRPDFSKLLTVQGGVYLFQLLDWYSSSFNTFLTGCLECVVIYWIYGSERFSKDIKTMLGRRPPTAALVVSLFGYDPPSYGEYLYPDIAKIMGILLAVGFSVPIPVMFVYECLRKKGSICQRVRLASQPTPDWGPLYDRTDIGVRLMPLTGMKEADRDTQMNEDILYK